MTVTVSTKQGAGIPAPCLSCSPALFVQFEGRLDLPGEGLPVSLGGRVGGFRLGGLFLDVHQLADEQVASVRAPGGFAADHGDGRGHVAALQIAAVAVDFAALAQLGEDHSRQVGEVCVIGFHGGPGLVKGKEYLLPRIIHASLAEVEVFDEGTLSQGFSITSFACFPVI